MYWKLQVGKPLIKRFFVLFCKNSILIQELANDGSNSQSVLFVPLNFFENRRLKMLGVRYRPFLEGCPTPSPIQQTPRGRIRAHRA